MILKASIDSGSASDGARVASSPVLKSIPFIGGTSSGDGR